MKKPTKAKKPRKPTRSQATAAAPGFAADIRPLFNDTDIDHMSFFCNLADYNDVKTNAADILDRLTGSGGPVMPPKSAGGPWPSTWLALFRKWIDGGFQP